METLSTHAERIGGHIQHHAQTHTFSTALIPHNEMSSADFRMLDELMQSALIPNLYFESWILKPAARSFSDKSGPFYLIIYSLNATTGEQSMRGVFPLSIKAMYRGLPIGNITLWHYPHCFMATPIIHKRFSEDCANELSRWFLTRRKESLIVLNLLPNTPQFDELFYKQMSRNNIRVSKSAYDRAYVTKSDNAQTFIDKRLPAKTRREYRRRYKKLEAMGNLQWELFDETSQSDTSEKWISDFLTLEASGWKGQSETALQSTEENESFFRDIVLSAIKKDSLKILSLTLDGKPIAMVIVFIAYGGGHTFKIAYDENYRKCAPGVILNIELIKRLHEWNDVDWIDTCSAYDNNFLKLLFPDRLPLCNIIVAKRYSIGAIVLRLLPLLSRIKKTFVTKVAKR